MDAKTEAIATADAHANNAGLPTYTELLAANAALRTSLAALVKLHADWDKGTAYVPVAFMLENKAAIAGARAAMKLANRPVQIIAETADGYFTARLDNGGVRIGLRGCECFDFPAGHAYYDRVVSLATDGIEAAHDEFMGRHACV